MDSLYSAFDTFPSAKGAGLHIYHVSQVLFQRYAKNQLYVLGEPGMPVHQIETLDENEGGSLVQINRHIPVSENHLDNALAYSQGLSELLPKISQSLSLVQFRDPWSGYVLLDHRHRFEVSYKCVFEVNGLPSIELPFAHPGIAPRTLDKVRAQEDLCLAHCDMVLTPAESIKENLMGRGVGEEKIRVVHNGADVPALRGARPLETQYVIYFGAPQSWQGIDDLLRAFAKLKDMSELKLVLCISRKGRRVKQYRKLADKLEISHRLIWKFSLKKEDLEPWIQHAEFSLAPLTDCSRNIDQGCCPIKILESMANATPVIASDIPSVREIVTEGRGVRLCQPRNPDKLALMMRILLEEPEELKRLSVESKRHIEDHLTWKINHEKMDAFYNEVEGKHG